MIWYGAIHHYISKVRSYYPTPYMYAYSTPILTSPSACHTSVPSAQCLTTPALTQHSCAPLCQVVGFIPGSARHTDGQGQLGFLAPNQGQRSAWETTLHSIRGFIPQGRAGSYSIHCCLSHGPARTNTHTHRKREGERVTYRGILHQCTHTALTSRASKIEVGWATKISYVTMIWVFIHLI